MFPVLAYGMTPYFLAYPGAASIRVGTYVQIVRDILDSLRVQGFRRFFFFNGHGGNAPAGSFAVEWMADHPDCTVKFHNWWNAPKTPKAVQETDPVAAHDSWMENFPWTRLAGVVQPTKRKLTVDFERMRTMSPTATRNLLGDGNFGGYYGRPDAEMQAIWDIAIAETRPFVQGPWARAAS